MNEILLVNPRKRRKGGKRRAKSRRSRVRLKRHASRRRRVHRVKARRYKRNPSSLSVRSIGASVMPTIKSGALGAVGALANDALVGQVAKLSFLPDVLKTGYGKHGLKIASAIIVGAAGNMVARGKGADLAKGAATVAIHDLLKEVIVTNLPSVGAYLGDYEDVGAYNPGMLVDDSANVGEYIPGTVGDYIPGFVGDTDDDM